MLSGVTVLSVSQYLAGPLAARILGDLGAEVIKIENVDGGDPYRYMNMPYDDSATEEFTNRFLQYNRGKQSIAVDLASEEGQDIVRSLASDIDVLIENQRTGQMDLFGLGYDELSQLNDDLVYCSISGYGETGPYRDRPAMDGLIQAASGLAHRNSTWADKPVFSGIYAADYLGGIYAAMSSLAGLVSVFRERDGTFIDISLMDAIVSLYGHEAAQYSATGVVSMDSTNSIVPYGIYETKDGRMALLVADDQWNSFCKILGFDDWVESGEFDDVDARQENVDWIDEQVQGMLLTESTDYWEDAFIDAGILASPVNTVEEVFNHPQVEHRETVRTMADESFGEFITPIYPALFSAFEIDNTQSVPHLGEHTDRILSELGYSAEDVVEFQQKGIVSLRD